jgi:hypothetical protein
MKILKSMKDSGGIQDSSPGDKKKCKRPPTSEACARNLTREFFQSVAVADVGCDEASMPTGVFMLFLSFRLFHFPALTELGSASESCQRAQG